MTNSTNSNIIINTNTNKNQVNYSKPDKYIAVRRSIKGVGGILLASKNNLKINKPSSQNSDTSSISYINVSPGLKLRHHLHRHKTETYIRSNFNETNQQPERIKIDLYRSSPTLFYIKEKYKMYLEWLKRNSNKETPIKLSINENKQANELNWYNYEKIVYLNETTGLDYLKNLSNETQIISQFDLINKKIKEPSRLTVSSMSSYRNNKKCITKKGLKSSVLRALSQQEVFSKDPEPVMITNLNYTNIKPNTTLNLKNILNKLSASKENTTEKLPKGVKFDQCNLNSNLEYSPIPITAVSIPLSNLKPILKTSNNSCYTNEKNFNNSNQTSIQSNTRRVSIISLNSNTRSEKTNLNFGITNSVSYKNFSNLKLPPIPIVNCSDDFYAVLHDLSKP